MKILDNFDLKEEKGSVITIGNFDGIHLGHKKLINISKKMALKNDLNCIVFSFNPHPLKVLKDMENFSYILSQEEKIRELLKEDIDIFLNYPFDLAFAKISPEDFINILCHKLKCKILVIGEDYRFGKNRAGNIDILLSIAKQKNIKIFKISNILIDGQRVSSTIIKEALLNKNIKKANLLLNRPYSILGTVVKGNQLARIIGFPTANLLPPKEKLLPADAVYITKTKVNNKIYNSITNIAKNPTVNNTNRTIETYIFDFKENIYDKEIEVMFLSLVRNVKKFDSLNDLKSQLYKDIAFANKFFNII